MGFSEDIEKYRVERITINTIYRTRWKEKVGGYDIDSRNWERVLLETFPFENSMWLMFR